MFKRINTAILLSIASSITISAATKIIPGDISEYKQKFAFTSKQFNKQNYHKCETRISSCPLTSRTKQNNCIDKLASAPSCKQLLTIAKKLNSKINLLTISPKGKALLIQQHFPADGQYAYHILTASGTLIDTNINPEIMNSYIKGQYPNKDFMTFHAKPANVIVFPQGDMTINFPMQAKTCVACKALFYYNLKFDFDKNGNYQALQMHTYAPL